MHNHWEEARVLKPGRWSRINLNKEHLTPSVQIFGIYSDWNRRFKSQNICQRFRTATSGKQRERTLGKFILLHPHRIEKEKYGKGKNNSIFLQRMHGGTKTVELTLPLSELALYNTRMQKVVEPGEFEIQVGSASDQIHFVRTIIVRWKIRHIEKQQIGRASCRERV